MISYLKNVCILILILNMLICPFFYIKFSAMRIYIILNHVDIRSSRSASATSRGHPFMQCFYNSLDTVAVFAVFAANDVEKKNHIQKVIFVCSTVVIFFI